MRRFWAWLASWHPWWLAAAAVLAWLIWSAGELWEWWGRALPGPW